MSYDSRGRRVYVGQEEEVRAREAEEERKSKEKAQALLAEADSSNKNNATPNISKRKPMHKAPQMQASTSKDKRDASVKKVNSGSGSGATPRIPQRKVIGYSRDGKRIFEGDESQLMEQNVTPSVQLQAKPALGSNSVESLSARLKAAPLNTSALQRVIDQAEGK